MSASQRNVLRAIASYCVPAYVGTKDDIFVKTETLAFDVKTSRSMVGYYMKQLQMLGFVEGRKGPFGGYRLTKQGIRTMGLI